MKNIVAAIFGKEASEDKDILSLYEDVNKIAMIELIKFVGIECENELSEEDAEQILKDYNESLNL
ncbi:MAG: hypothetical protein ACWA5P_01685 [bacterium]